MVQGSLLEEVSKNSGLEIQTLRYRCLRLGIPKRGGIYILSKKEEEQVLGWGRLKAGGAE